MQEEGTDAVWTRSFLKIEAKYEYSLTYTYNTSFKQLIEFTFLFDNVV